MLYLESPVGYNNKMTENYLLHREGKRKRKREGVDERECV
jgi:hypothetical protein